MDYRDAILQSFLVTRAKSSITSRTAQFFKIRDLRKESNNERVFYDKGRLSDSIIFRFKNIVGQEGKLLIM